MGETALVLESRPTRPASARPTGSRRRARPAVRTAVAARPPLRGAS